MDKILANKIKDCIFKILQNGAHELDSGAVSECVSINVSHGEVDRVATSMSNSGFITKKSISLWELDDKGIEYLDDLDLEY